MRLPVISRRPSPAMGVAFLALVLAVSGTAVALPGKNLITSDDIKKGAVKDPDIGRGAVSVTKLRDGAVSTAKLRNDAVTGAKINEGSLGAVPSANTAATAENANRLGGQAPSHYEETATAGFRNGPVSFSNALETIATLNLAAGSYAISAKLYATSISGANRLITCRLEAEGDTDETHSQLIATEVDEASIALQVVHTSAGTFPVLVRCVHDGGATAGGVVTANQVKITALPLDSLTNVELTG